MTDPGDPPRSRIVLEIVFFAAVVLLAGAVFVAWRMTREGPRILEYDVRDKR